MVRRPRRRSALRPAGRARSTHHVAFSESLREDCFIDSAGAAAKHCQEAAGPLHCEICCKPVAYLRRARMSDPDAQVGAMPFDTVAVLIAGPIQEHSRLATAMTDGCIVPHARSPALAQTICRRNSADRPRKAQTQSDGSDIASTAPVSQTQLALAVSSVGGCANCRCWPAAPARADNPKRNFTGRPSGVQVRCNGGRTVDATSSAPCGCASVSANEL